MKVVFASGGSGGPVTPLIAIYEELKNRDAQLEAIWIGTSTGPEKNMVEQFKIDFRVISSGKLRRYFSIMNFIDPFFVFLGFLQSIFILRKFKPDVVLTAGSFVAVPVAYAAKFLKIPIFVHQQDLQKGLANKLMSKKATVVTVSLRDSLGDFDVHKTYHVGNPVRKDIFTGSKEKAYKLFKLDPNLSTVLVLGGGQGAEIINQILLESVGKITENFQVLHLTGKGKGIKSQFADYYDRQTCKIIEARYHDFEFLHQEIFDAYAVADLVVSRSGFATISELAVLGKPAVLIPIPGHQELNAQFLGKYNAAKVIRQEKLNKETFTQVVVSLLGNPSDLQGLSRNISQVMDKDAAKKYVDLITKVLEGNK